MFMPTELLRENIEELARARLLASSYADVRRVMCESEHGILTLRGIVTSYFHKQLAQEAVRGLIGRPAILNCVEVVDVLSHDLRISRGAIARI